MVDIMEMLRAKLGHEAASGDMERAATSEVNATVRETKLAEKEEEESVGMCYA